MDVYALNAALNAQSMAGLSDLGAAADSQQSSISFSDVLASMGQTDTGNLDLTADAGMTYRDAQSAAMNQILASFQSQQPGTTLDPVLADLLKQLRELFGLSTEQQTQGWTRITQQIQQQLKKILDEQGAQNAGYQALEMLNSLSPSLVADLAAGSGGDAAGLGASQAALQMVLSAPPEQLANTLQNLQPQQTQTQAAQVQAPPVQAAPLPKPTEPKPVLETQPAETLAVEKQPVEVLAVQTGPGQAQTAFSEVVQKVKMQMAEQVKPQAKPPVDLDELQKQVDAGTFLEKTALAHNGITPSTEAVEQPVPAQLQQAILTGMARGDDQIVLKLNPESLGEVTIQLQKTAEGMILNIIAKNPDTQKLLAQDLNLLQDALKPMKVEVAAIVTERQYELLSGEQNFGGQHQRTWKEMHGAAYYKDEPLSAETQDLPPRPIVTGSPASILDAYI